MKNNETVIILGDSPYLENVKEFIPKVLENNYSLGINNIIRKYETDIHIFQDIPFCALTNEYPNIKTVAPLIHGDLIRKKNKELINSFSFSFWMNKSKEIYKDGKLAWCGFTHDYAITYCIMKGFTKIVLIGAADFTKGKHFMTDTEFSPSQKLATLSRKFIKEVCSQKANIYTCNPDSLLNIPRLDISSLT